MPDPVCLPEDTRNRLLRRVDWRFLLPLPEPARVVCFGPDAVADGLRLISGEVLGPRDATDGTCDLAVVIPPDSPTLSRARSALQPGGWLYAEWRRPVLGGPPAIARQLMSARFTDIHCYWAWPNPARRSADLWLPLDTPGASSFVLAARPLVQEAIPRARQLALRIAWRAMRRLGLLAPVCVVARKAMSGETVERPSDAPHRRAPLILLTGGHRSVNKVVGVVMRDHGAEPSAVVKMPRVPESIPALWNEARTLQQLEGRPNPVQGAPRVLSFVEQGASTRLVESAIRGVPVAARLRAGTYRRFALQAADWQIRLAGRAAPVGTAAWWDRLVEPALAEVSAAYGPVLDVCQLERTREQLSGLSALPLVCEQRDFSPWNVLVDGNGELAVLDWESSELRGLPALDLIYFLAYLAFYVDGAMASGRFRQAHRRALDPSTPTGRVTHDALRRYCEGVGLDPTALGPLRLLTWLIHARSEYRQLTADAGHRPSPEQLRSAVFITLWQEELRNVEAGARNARAFGWDHGKAASP